MFTYNTPCLPKLKGLLRALDTPVNMRSTNTPLRSAVGWCTDWNALPRGSVVSNSSRDTAGVQKPGILVQVGDVVGGLMVVLIKDLRIV